MARQETIKILRSEVPSATPSLTAGEVAVNIADRRFFIGGTGGTSDKVTFRDELSTAWSINGLTGSITLTGDGASLVGIGNTNFTNRLATTGVTGVASFLSTQFTVSGTGHVSLASAYQATGDTVTGSSYIGVSRSGNSVTIHNNGIVDFNSTTGSVSLAGDGQSVTLEVLPSAGEITAFGIKNRLATTGSTGVASFNANDFSVSSTGHVRVSTTATIIRFFDSFGDSTTPRWGGDFYLTGGSGIEVDLLSSGPAVFSFRGITATTSTRGVASFNSSHFTVTNGAVSLVSGSTGDSVQAGSGIAISANKTITNIGVTGFNGLTGNITVTGDSGSLVGKDNNRFTNRLATTGGTGVASFLGDHFTVSATGHVSSKGVITINNTPPDGNGNFTIASATVVTGDGGSLRGDGAAITARVSSGSLTGVASFDTRFFTVGSTGHVVFSGPTGDTVITTAGSGIAISTTNNTDTLFNIGVTGFNGLTGNITVTGDGGSLVGAVNNRFTNRLADASATGVASFNSTYFSVASGAVSLAAAYQATGDTVITTAGSGIAISTSGKTDTIFNIGVTAFNGATGALTLTGDGGAVFSTQTAKSNLIGARLATSSLTGVASFDPNAFTVSATGQVAMSTTAAIAVNFRDSFNGLVSPKWGSTVTLTGGSGIEVQNTASNVLSFRGITATSSTLGVASFLPSYFSVSSGAVSLAAAYQATGDSVQAGLGIAISANKTITNIGVTGVGFGSDVGLTGKVNITAGSNITITQSGNLITFSGVAQQVTAVTGDGGAIVGRDNSNITARVSTTGVTGVASFLSTHFAVSGTGHVSLAAAYQATGDTVQAGSGIAISANKTITNIGVTGFNGLTGNITVTGDGGSLVGIANNRFTNRLADTSVTGVASFNSSYFSVSSGAVSLAAAYQATGDTVITTAGSGIAISTSGKTDTLFNIGVTGFNGLTGNITVTGDGGSLVGVGNNRFTNRLADASATGVASFNSSYFTVSGGAVSLAAAYQATGDNSRIATSALTGVASFDTRFFTVGSTGHVILAAAYQATGDSVQAGSGIAISANKTITNIGVTGFNGLTGNITVTGDGGSLVGIANNRFTNRLSTTGVTGVASFLSTHFAVSGTGHVSLAAAYQATGDTVITVPGSGIAISTSGRTDTLFNIGVTGFNGLTGNITVTGDGGSLVGKDNNRFTNRITQLWDDTASPTTGLTGVSMFNCRDFVVSPDGLVSLAAFSQCNAGGGGGCNCTQYTTEGTCVAAGCGWVNDFGGGSCYCPNPFTSPYSGIGASADANGELAFLYFDIGNLSAAPSGTTILSTDSILFYDASETGLIKTKRATISKLILDNDNLFSSKSSSQFTTTRGSSSIEFGVVLGRVAANDQGLIKGATAFAYIEQNTVRTINGLTGALQVVGSINGCSGNSLTITGTVNEVDVTNSCPTITIGLPDNVTIPYISGTGATFTGTVNANLFIGTVSGGTF